MGWHHVGAISIIIAMGNVAVLSQMRFYRDYLGVGAMAGILVPFIIIDLLFATSYLRAIFTPPGAGSEVKSRRSRRDKDEWTKRCIDCCEQKPDRSHHCSQCKKCVLRMDHHCPWINNCVGFKNHKFFYLTLVYGALLQIYCIALCAYYLSLFGSSSISSSPWAIYYCVTIVFVSISFTGTMVLFVLHTFLLYVNRTTLEHFRLNTGAKYDLGCLENFAQVMGSSVSVWCVPCIWGVDNQLYNGGEWEPGKVIVVPSDSPEVLPALVGPASVGTANYWQGEPLGLGGSGKFSVHEGDGANSFSAAHKWRGDVLHHANGSNVYEGDFGANLGTIPQQEGVLQQQQQQQQQPWWNRGSQERGSGIWAYNSQQSMNSGPPTGHGLPVANGGNQSPLQQLAVKNAQTQWINGGMVGTGTVLNGLQANLTPVLSRSNSRDTSNSVAGANQGVFVQGSPLSMSTMIRDSIQTVGSVENGGAGNQGWSVHPAPQIRTVAQHTVPRQQQQQQQHTVPLSVGTNPFPSEVKPTVTTPRTAPSFGPPPPKLSPRGRPSYSLSGYPPARLGDGGQSSLSRPGPRAVAM